MTDKIAIEELAELVDETFRKDTDAMTLEEMLETWRFAPAGTFTTGDPSSDYFMAVMQKKRADDPDGWVSASKRLSR